MDSTAIKPPQPPPPPQPEPPKVSVSISAADLNPFLPQYAGALLVLQASGMDVSQLSKPAPASMQVNPGMVKPDMGMGGEKPEGSGGMQGSSFKAPIAPGGQGMDNAN
jgi:hypothetical protein